MPQQRGKDSDYKWFWERLNDYLSSKDLKQTSQRRQIVESFLQLNTHLDAETLYEALRQKGLNIGLATVYRTMNLLKEAGLAEQKSFADGKSVFEINLPDEHHDHLICIDCNEVIEFENDEIEKLQEAIARKHGFELKAHRLDLFGACIKNPCPRRPAKMRNA